MFGSKKVEGLEAQIRNLKDQLESEKKENERLNSNLSSARRKITELEQKLTDTDFEALKAEQASVKAEYEGLRDMYTKKIQAFENSKEEEERAFARKAALDRFNLDNEIKENRQANQDYVVQTVRTFSDTYNYYLNQIKVLMDALGNVATQTGQALFSDPADDLKTNFGLRMADQLKSETDELRSDSGDLILIGSVEEAEKAEEEAEAAEEACEETVEEAAEAAEETVEEAAEAVEETVEEAVEEAAEEVTEAAEEAAEETVEAAEETAEKAEEVLEEAAEAAAEPIPFDPGLPMEKEF